MATGPSTITGLPAAATITGSEKVPMDQGGNGASVQTSLLGLITGTVATTALTGAEIFQTDQSGTLKKVTLDQLITQQTASTSLAGTELFVLDQGGTTVKTTLAQLISQLTASTAIAGTELVTTLASSTPKKTTVSQLITQATASSAIAGTEVFSNVGAAYQQTTVAQLVTQATAAATPAVADKIPTTQSGNWRATTVGQLTSFCPYNSGGGTANAQTVTLSPVPSAYYTGMYIVYLPSNANTGATTINVNGLGTKNIFAYGAALLGGELQTNVPAELIYDGTQFQFINPNDATGSFTVTLATGWTTTPTGTVNWRIVKGRTAFLFFPSAVTGTSSAGTFICTGLPAALQPVTTKRVTVSLEDNSAVASIQSALVIAASGTFNGTLTLTTGGFTATASTKGFIAGTECSYTLD